MVAIYCFLKRENCKVLKFHVNKLSFLELNAPYFKHCPLMSAAS